MTKDSTAHDPIPPPLVKRTTLIVRRMARSIEFYRDVIGMSIWYDDEITLSGVASRLAPKEIARSFRVHAVPHAFSVKGANGQQLQMTSLSLWDPDDFFIEYSQRQETI